MTIGTEVDSFDRDKIDELLRKIEGIDLQDIDPDALREAEFEQTRLVLDELAGKTIKRATLEDSRIVVETGDGNRYFFYGFLGCGALFEE